MTPPKSILRTSSFKTKVQPKFIDEELSMFSSVVSNFKPPFMRKEAKIAEQFLEKKEDERDDEDIDDPISPFENDLESNEEVDDDRINMSLTFDKMIRDDISMGVTFDLDQKDSFQSSNSEEGLEKSLEITIENYLEFEKLKQVNNAYYSKLEREKLEEEEALKKELQDLRKIKEAFEEEQRMKKLNAKLDEEQRRKTFVGTVNQETELVEKLKQRVANAKEMARRKKAKAEIKKARIALEKGTPNRVPVAEKIQERLRSTVEMIAAANTTQDLLDLEVSNITARSSTRLPHKPIRSVQVPLSDNSKRLIAPPPVKENLHLPDNYRYIPDLNLDLSPSFIERLEYVKNSSYDSDLSEEIMRRPSYRADLAPSI